MFRTIDIRFPTLKTFSHTFITNFPMTNVYLYFNTGYTFDTFNTIITIRVIHNKLLIIRKM